MGKGFSFVGRQFRISTETSHFYIDLVFYNYLFECFVLIDLKNEKLTHQDIGQMDMYVRVFDDLKRGDDDNPTRLSKNPLCEKSSQKSPTTGSKIAKMLCGTPKTRRFSAFLSHFSKIIFEKGLFRQLQQFALPAADDYQSHRQQDNIE